MNYNDKRLVSLDAIRRPAGLADRLMLFYDLFGCQDHGKGVWIICWSDAEVAQVVGWLHPDGTPNAASIRQARSRLVRDGCLEKVTERQKGREFYSYRPASARTGLMDDGALAILSEKVQKVTYCRPEDRGWLTLKAEIDELPNILLLDHRGNRNWHDVLPDLLDLSDTAVLDFWKYKALQALDGRDHPLREIGDRDLRLQVALLTIDRILTRNINNNPGWMARDAVAWTLKSLTLVGKEADWKVREDIQQLEAVRASPQGHQTLRTWAQQHLDGLRGGTSTSASSTKQLLEQAKQRHEVAARRRGSPAGGSTKIHGGFRQFGFGTENEPGGDALRWDALVSPGGQGGRFSVSESVEQGLGEDAAELDDALDGDLVRTPRPDDRDVLDGDAASDAASSGTAASAPMDLFDFFDDDDVALKTRRVG